MKCLLLFFTVCSVGRLFNVQGQDESDSDTDSDNILSLLSEAKAEKDEQEDDTALDDPSDDGEVIDNRYKDDLASLLSGVGMEEDGQEEDTSSDESSDDAKAEIKKPGNAMSAKQAYELNEDEIRHRERQQQLAQFETEKLAGNPAELIGQNEHIRQANFYEDLGRRSLPRDSRNTAVENDNYLTPEKAPPELVLLVAKESALLRPGKDADLASDFDQKKILRSGDYWNGVWKEEVQPKSVMRSGTQKKNLGSIKAKINEGTELYKVVSKMKEISPKLLYIINKKQL